MGIGLYICREIIAKHNGTLWVESEIGAGSTFNFTLPIIEEKRIEMQGKKIMICDDDDSILEVLQMMLEIDGHTVFLENNSTNLIKQINNINPDILLMDLWMPVLSGDQLLRTIRTTDELKDLPVIILSASVDGKEIANSAGADMFIAKPFDMDDVSSGVEKLLLV